MNKIALQMEEFYGKPHFSVDKASHLTLDNTGRPFTKKSYLPHSKIEGLLEAAAGDPVKATALQLVEWLAIGATDIPEVEVQVQRKKYFSNVHFRTVGELLDDSRRLDKV